MIKEKSLPGHVSWRGIKNKLIRLSKNLGDKQADKHLQTPDVLIKSAICSSKLKDLWFTFTQTETLYSKTET